LTATIQYFARAAGACVLLAALAGCDKKPPAQPEAPAGAKVNGTSITVERIEAVVKGGGTVPESQFKEVSRQALEKMIDQELLVQQAQQNKLDADPRIAMAMDLVRREVLAKAWLDKLGDALPKPTAEAVDKFYQDHPGLFAQRRIYRFLQLNVTGDESLRSALETKLKELDASPDKGTIMQRLAAWLQSQSIQYRAGNSTQTAEQLPLDMLPKFVSMKNGDLIVMAVRGGYQVMQLAASQDQPVDLEKAKPAIEQFLTTRARLEATQAEVKRLRAAAKIEYMEGFKDAAAPAAPPAAAEPSAPSPAEPAGAATGSGESAPAKP